MSSTLEGKRALVTGASRGIGRAIATAFSEAGADVALLSRSRDQLEAVAADLDGETLVTVGDVSDTESVNDCIDEVTDAFGGLDVVVNNAGVVTRDDLGGTPDDDIERVIDVNLHGVIRVARRSLPHLVESEGTLLNVGSMAAERGIEGLSSYSASKGGVSSLTRQLAIEYGDRGVRVNAIVPGTIKTPVNEAVRESDPEWTETRREQVPLGRLGDPEDVADPAVFLASDRSRYVTGHVLPVDGGVLASA
ncbi:SDR family NAD(P)-dependent oxidoreductase [Halomicroarcula sp. GCM10025817]|uniref:SDR family NAD(P)-dependent oxidoreductase n=1 Tax=Haloarcula TaxID=2237 RepID=UPI0023E8E60D|nr:SDR family NAD(P)-dependent oxidoreductase [Halomicroarcula sp. SYNS111]